MQEVKARLMLHPNSSLIDVKDLKPCYHIKDEEITSEHFQITCDFKLSESTPVQAVIFDNCLMTKCPSFDSIVPYVPTITCLGIQSSGISEIDGDDFYGFSCLRELLLPYNDIEFLPENLFMHMPNLLEVSFAHNKIKCIDPFIFDNARHLRVFNLLGNSKINMKYSKNGTTSFDEFRYEVLTRCNPMALQLEEFSSTIDNQKNIIKRQEMEIAKLRQKCNNQEILLEVFKKKSKEQVDEVTKSVEEMRSLLENLDGELKVDKDEKNFTVYVLGHEFVVNKIKLAASCPPLKKIFDNHPDISCLELKNLSVMSFSKIKQFLQTGVLTTGDMNLLDIIDLFGACLKLEINDMLKEVKIQIMKKLEMAPYQELERAIVRCESIVCSSQQSAAIDTLIKQVSEKLKV